MRRIYYPCVHILVYLILLTCSFFQLPISNIPPLFFHLEIKSICEYSSFILKRFFNISCKTKNTPKLVSLFKNSLRMIRFTKMSSKSFHNQIIKFICITGTTAVTIRHLTTNSISSAKKPETLVSVQMFSRHGARTPLYLVNGIEEVLHLMF